MQDIKDKTRGIFATLISCRFRLFSRLGLEKDKGQRHRPAALPSRKQPIASLIRVCLGPRLSLGAVSQREPKPSTGTESQYTAPISRTVIALTELSGA
jgi:hypothetical protein